MKKTRLYQDLKDIYKLNHLPIVIRFAKVTLFHIIFETLISVYILELFAVLTSFFLIDPTALSKTLILVVFPILITLPLSTIYGIWCTVYFAKRVCKYPKEYLNADKQKVSFDIISKQYKKEVIIVHFAGIIFYLISTAIISIALINLYPEKFAHPIPLAVSIPALGSALGIIWNVTGINRNQRLMWHELLPEFNQPEITKKVAQNNYRFYMNNIIGNALSLFFLFVILAVIFLNLHPKLMIDDILRIITTDYGFLLISFVALVVFYLKIGCSLLYISENNTEKIYPTLESILAITQEE